MAAAADSNKQKAWLQQAQCDAATSTMRCCNKHNAKQQKECPNKKSEQKECPAVRSTQRTHIASAARAAREGDRERCASGDGSLGMGVSQSLSL
jgi:hypothetical protein